MREILFRGKLISSDEWVYGGFTYGGNRNEPLICPRYDFAKEVFHETVGQYTGLTDKNGKKIFEGDIVKHFDNSNEKYDIGAIYYDISYMGWRRTTNGNFHKRTVISYKLSSTCVYEVIGNIHDNSELLKGDDNNGGIH